MSDTYLEATPPKSQTNQGNSGSLESTDSMAEFYQLQKKLFLGTLVCTGVLFVFVWLFYSLNIALSYLLGAVVGMAYLRMLARDVETLGQQKRRLGSKGLALFVGLIVVVSRYQQLHVLPAFFGFMTFKAALIIYMLQTNNILSRSKSERANVDNA